MTNRALKFDNELDMTSDVEEREEEQEEENWENTLLNLALQGLDEQSEDKALPNRFENNENTEEIIDNQTTHAQTLTSYNGETKKANFLILKSEKSQILCCFECLEVELLREQVMALTIMVDEQQQTIMNLRESMKRQCDDTKIEEKSTFSNSCCDDKEWQIIAIDPIEIDFNDDLKEEEKQNNNNNNNNNDNNDVEEKEKTFVEEKEIINQESNNENEAMKNNEKPSFTIEQEKANDLILNSVVS